MSLYADINYYQTRPLRDLGRRELLARLDACLENDLISIDMAHLCLAELRYRRRKGVQEGISLFKKQGVEPIAWFEEARQSVIEAFQPSSNSRHRGKVYVILRDGYVNNGPYGLYVGSTRQPLEKRFNQHISGPRGARGLQKYGIGLMHSLFAWINPVTGKTEDLRKIETRLHKTFETLGIRVSGDVVQDVS